MKSRWTALTMFAVLLVAATLQLAWYYPLLPERMASHFDGQGRADGWSSKAAFFGISAGVLYGVSGLLLLVAFSMRWWPASTMNLPHKGIWLAPLRSSEKAEPHLGSFGSRTFSGLSRSAGGR